MILESFMLMTLASPIAMALIIYTELSNVYKKNQQIQQFIVVITDGEIKYMRKARILQFFYSVGVPILVILASEFTIKTLGWKHEFWWLIINSGVYNIFMFCSILLIITYVILYFAVIYMTKPFLLKFKANNGIQIR